MALKGGCTIFGKIDMFLKTFRLLVFAISNLDIRPYKDFWVQRVILDVGTWQYFKIKKVFSNSFIGKGFKNMCLTISILLDKKIKNKLKHSYNDVVQDLI